MNVYCFSARRILLVLGLVIAAQAAEEASCSRRIRGEGEESTLIILKPDAVSRGHVGEAISRFERAGLELVEIRTTPKASTEVLQEHYKEHAARKFYQELIDSMSSGPIVIMHLRGSKAVSRVRNMLGATDPSTADPGSLRGTFGIDKTNQTIRLAHKTFARCVLASAWVTAFYGFYTITQNPVELAIFGLPLLVLAPFTLI